MANKIPLVFNVPARRIVWNVFHALALAGYVPTRIDTGDGENIVDGTLHAMELIFNLDEARVYFKHAVDDRQPWLFLVGGNNVDVVSNYSAIPPTFVAAIESIDPEALHVCLSCHREAAPVRGRCPECGVSSWRSESLQRNLSDYAKGLDRRTHAAGSLSVVAETNGHYFAVLDSDGSKLMCGFDSAEQAFAWCIHRGHMPVRTDDDVLKLLNLMDLSEKKQ